MYTTLFYIIISIIIIEYALDFFLDYKNRSYANNPIPKELENLYDKEKYDQQQEYFIINNKFRNISNAFNLVIMLCMLSFYGFGYVDNLSHLIIHQDNSIWSYILTGLTFLGILFIANELISIPFSLYSTFHIEQRFGFNKSTPKLFFTDTIKELCMSLLLGGIIIGILIAIYFYVKDYFWVLAWLVVSTFSILMMLFYSNLIVPLFNKQTPLEDGELRTAIEAFCEKVNFKIDNLYVMDNSKRTTKANAYFTGFGPKKRIVLFDTLISTLSTEEIVAVLTHEIGHYKKAHTIKMLLINIIYLGFLFFILSIFLNQGNLLELNKTLGSSYENSFWLGLIAFTILFTPISTLLSIIINLISRKNEYQADNFAKINGLSQNLISALKKLSTSTLSNLTPHPLYVFFHFSHPTLHQRIIELNK